MKALAIQVQKESGTKLIVDEQNKLPIDIFISWATGNEKRMLELGVNPRKGLLLRGNPGSGKSIMFRTLRELLKHDEYYHLYRKLTYTTAEAVAKKFIIGGEKELNKYTTDAVRFDYGRPNLSHVCFDDLGNEEAKKHFGNFKEVMKDVITERYDHFVDHGLISCFTTNLTMDDIESRYDQRVRSRLEQMCNIVGIGSNKEKYIDRRINN
jgi:DNA replication protein DnaC